MYTVLLVIHSILVVFLILLVLLQRTDNDGLSGMSGGGGNQFLTGRAQASLITRVTAILAAGFMATSLILAIMASHRSSRSIIDTINTQPISAPVSAPAQAPAEKTEKSTEQSKDKLEKQQAPTVPKPE